MAMGKISASRLAEETQTRLNQAALDTKLSNLKSQDLANAVINVYVTKISTSNKEKRFIDVKRLKVHNSAKESFKSYVTECIEGNDHISELRTINTNQDNRFFMLKKLQQTFLLWKIL